MKPALLCARIWPAVLPMLWRAYRHDNDVRRHALLIHAGHHVDREIGNIARTLETSRTHIRAAVLERLAGILDGSETETDVNGLISELLRDMLNVL